MARIAGVDIPNDKQICISLTYIYGIGVASSNKILAKENKISTNFYDFEVQILIDLSTIAKDTLYTQNQNTNLK